LLGLLEAAEIQERLAAGLLRAYALAELALDGHFEVRAEFLVEIRVEAGPAEQSEDAAGESAGFHFAPFDGQQEEALAGIARLLLAVNRCSMRLLERDSAVGRLPETKKVPFS